MSMKISIVKHFKMFILSRRFDDFIDFMKVKFISKNQYNNNAIFGIQIHLKMSKNIYYKKCAKVEYIKCSPIRQI